MKTPVFVFRLRKRFRRAGGALPSLFLTVGAVVACAALMLIPTREPSRLTDPQAGAAVAPGMPESLGSPPLQEKLAARMEAAAVEVTRRKHPDDLSDLPIIEVAAPLRSVDGTSFRFKEEVIRFARIDGPRAGDVCLDGETRWSCGLQARAALHNLVAGRSLFCQPRRALADGTIAADCRIEPSAGAPGGDIAHLLVLQGWARPLPDGEASFADELREAQAKRAGLWRGGWTLRAP